ncbi:hypothetical protein [Nitrosopumilus sp. b2]|uniref:hypothetical protein n=1 Tax=Nitrosopumilus sp. b2 TaxID=2109908 RepID=UPI0015F6868D|nr:hypothetical protein [Nitrosopumilus sp. b2]KAF6244921.1 hypothetical protein C6989_05950 [Nitrosopumilus sp. b2]
MGVDAIFFLSRIELLDKFFGNSSFHQLIVSDIEMGALEPLIKKGYLDKKKITRFVKRGIIVSLSGKSKLSPSSKNITPEQIIQKISTTFHKNNNDFVMVEDDVIRNGLKKKRIKVLTVPDVIFFLVERKDITKTEAVEALEWCKLFQWYDNKVINFIIKEVSRLG